MRFSRSDFSPSDSPSNGTPREDVFDRYFAGAATPAESEEVRAYLDAQYPGAEPLLARPATTYVGLQGRATETSVLWDATMERIAARALDESASGARMARTTAYDRDRFAPPTSAPRMPQSVSRIRKTGVWALAFGLVLAVPSLAYIANKTIRANVEPSELRTVVAKVGQRVNYHFPDGSSAVLAPGTTLRYAADFGKTTREIVLDGEALFTVTQNDGVPFLVRNRGTTVRVLGTTFSVRRYANDTSLNVVVAQGKVSVAAHILTSGDAAAVNTNGTVQLVRGIDIASEMSWTTGQLSFRRTPLRDVIPELERWYGISVSVTDPELLNHVLTAVFLVNEPKGALTSLASLLQVPMTQSGDHVTFGNPE